jgi:hypothetical protein
VDHRLVRERHIESCSHQAAALYLFLVTVADSQGLSYYSDAALMRRLSMDVTTLDAARQNLVEIRLIAYKKPIYQVLSLDPAPYLDTQPPVRMPMDKPLPITEIFKQMMGGRQ